MTIAIISHPDCALHKMSPDHPEQPARLAAIAAGLKAFYFPTPLEYHLAPLITREQLIQVHDKHYVDWIISIAPKQGTIAIDEDTAMNKSTLTAALHAAGAAEMAVDLVMQDKAQVVFCNIRPPGHHAEFEKAMGFCFFNNVAIAAHRALHNYHLKRVAIVDFDVHHGNGTQQIFQNNQRVLYCSSFEHPLFPGYDAENDNEHILSVPLARGTESAEFREKVAAAWFDKIAAFQPELILFSAGFDAHANDPLATIRLTNDDYVWITEHIAKIAKVYCGGKMISLLEGGYNLEVLKECVPLHVNAMVWNNNS